MVEGGAEKQEGCKDALGGGQTAEEAWPLTLAGKCDRGAAKRKPTIGGETVAGPWSDGEGSTSPILYAR